MAIKIINDKCKGCSLCVKACPFDALKLVDRIAVVDEGKCTNCNACIAKCKKPPLFQRLLPGTLRLL